MDSLICPVLIIVTSVLSGRAANADSMRFMMRMFEGDLKLIYQAIDCDVFIAASIFSYNTFLRWRGSVVTATSLHFYFLEGHNIQTMI